MNRKIFIITVLSLLSIFLQFIFISRIPLFDLTADIVLIPISYVAINYGRLNGTVFGFIAGFALDIITGFWGVNALSKTITGYIFGNFHTESKPLGNWDRIQYLQVFFFATFVHFSIFSGINHLHMIDNVWSFIFKYVLGQTVYSVIFAGIFAFYYWRVRR